MTGQFAWYDLMTSDTAAAKAFYTECIGWKTAQWEGGNSDYTMWKAGEQTIGGVMTLPEKAKAMGAPPHWLAYVGVDNVEDTAARVTSLGGEVLVPPTAIPSVGKFTIFKDPQGAVMAAFAAESEMPEQGGEAPGFFSWHELATSDPTAAWSFYSDLFGWKKTSSMDMGEMGSYDMFNTADSEGEASLGGVFAKPPNMPASAWILYVNVDTVNGAIERVKSNGGQVVHGPMEVPGGSFVAQCIDPQGAFFAVHSAVA